MSTDATSAGKPASSTGGTVKPSSTRAADKDKGKGKEVEEDEDDEDEDDEEDEMEEDDEDEDVETYDEIDPSAILPTGRRTRGVKVDYTSSEALRKAGFTKGDDREEEEGDNSFAHDDAMEH